MCMHLSMDPLAKYSPLGLKATEYTGSLGVVKKIHVSMMITVNRNGSRPNYADE